LAKKYVKVENDPDRNGEEGSKSRYNWWPMFLEKLSAKKEKKKKKPYIYKQV